MVDMSTSTNTTTNTGTNTTTPEITAQTVQPTIDGYFSCWNTTDAEQRSATVRRVWGPEARLVDPLVDVNGHDAIVATMSQFHETYAGHSFRQAGGVDVHHGIARWGWEMLDAAGTVVLDGLDVALVADDGTIGYCVGFFGQSLPDA